MARSMEALSGSSLIHGRSFLKGVRRRRRSIGVRCSMGGIREEYKTLRIQPGATEGEVKAAFRQLALQYHPDVCKGSNCNVQFTRINEAYDVVMSNLREEPSTEDESSNGHDYVDDDMMRGMHDSNWDLWEEWMGWEGAGIRDYSSHINPYI
eukprot:TRINITY_DN2824_c0_g4_i1.p1 TRINITY_DN2824_c0_g4~~TRINITY_DN2824_c0_g4_i1.p1  ORF type:complete len:152 (-),score=29.03 TRINITY_DN2824_c0_g4_i1:183-638(-)